MSDLISRQAAIAYSISGMTREIDGAKWIRVSEVRESLNTMPSAQPEIIKCNDCKWFDISEPSGTVEPIGHKCKRRRIFVDSDDFCKRGEMREE